MNKMNGTDHLIKLFREWSGVEPEVVSPIPGSGSNRQYCRLGSPGLTVMGAWNEDVKENRAFLSFTRSFLEQGLPVPAIRAESADGLCYLLDDLGDTTLFGFLREKRGEAAGFPHELIPLYRQVLEWLPRFQVAARPDYKLCYPRAAFDGQSMLWDLNYFKYYYLKLAGIPFDEQHLEDDFTTFTSFLLEAPSEFFMYRDFQSRNVMLHDGKTWFIDYQGGRRGALQYDLVSLLYDAKADLPENVRTELLEFYLQGLSEHIQVNRGQFLNYYPGFILIRILQAMGAYGFRGYYEKKQHFLQSIPYALRNLETIRQLPFLKNFPELGRVITRMIDTPLPAGITKATDAALDGSPAGGPIAVPMAEELTVKITSFAFKNGYPVDPTGNGGGFVFDCRALPNPGRYEQYKKINGKDQLVIDFLKKEPEVDTFLQQVFLLVDQSVKEYQQRRFNHLMVNFGCTGGQHRSVYCAEALARHLREKTGVEVSLSHREQE